MPSFLRSLFCALAQPNGANEGDLLSTRRKYRLLVADGYVEPATADRPRQPHRHASKGKTARGHLRLVASS